MLKYLHSLDYEELIARVSFCAFIWICLYLIIRGAIFSIALEYYNNGVYF